MSTISLTISRVALSLPDLVISNDHTSELWIDEISPPGFSFRYNYAPDSDHIPGSTLLSAVLEASQIPLALYVRSASASAKATKMAALEAAVSQFSYSATLTLDGIAQAFSADPTWPVWSWDSGMASAFMARASVVIPVNPIGA